MLCSTFFLAVTCLLINSAGSQKLRTVACEGSVAQLKCDKGKAISVSSATYGRRDRKTCIAGRPAYQIQNVRCSWSFIISPVKKIVHTHMFHGVRGKPRGPPGQVAHLSKDKVAERCNGKQRCSIRAVNSVFGDPCIGTYKYLEVDYVCYGEFRP
ncbi:L-rhamnose-binding lectin CSL3-like [Anableps anableps]